MDLSLYEKKLNAKSTTEAFVNDTIDVVNIDFPNSSTYRKILLNGKDSECIFKTTKKSNEKRILFRPKTKVDKGMYVEFDNDTYMIIEFVQNEIYPKATIKVCNNVLRWKDENDSILEYGCILEGDSLSLGDRDIERSKFVSYSDAEIIAYVQYNNDTKSINLRQRFLFDDYAYEVIAIDKVSNVYNDSGFIKLELKSHEISESDINENGVADNTSNSGWGGW